ncbi:MAG: GNAT family N-acetyltransferase [Chloroflexota bacterium]|nr:GNAT family N-acetyltransferase [Chloroflexota bacterium]
MTIEIPRREDAPTIERVATDTGVFSPEEIHIVSEMLDAFFDPEPRDDHTFVIYRNGNPDAIAGFACYGPFSLADRVWDLYWLCVDRVEQRHGIGSQLLQHIEQDARARGARAIYLETSDSETYATAREFYERHGYALLAHIDDFYAPGEGKVIYRKRFEN